jgi:hypothetical protein
LANEMNVASVIFTNYSLLVHRHFANNLGKDNLLSDRQ